MSPRPALVCALSIALGLGLPSPSLAFLQLGASVNGQVVPIRWSQLPIRYFVTNRTVGAIDPPAFQAAVDRAFSTWQSVPTSSVSYTFGGYTDALPGQDDGLSTLGFVDRPDLDRVLASTSFLVDAATGAVLESDIFFNSEFAWSVSAAGEPDHYDLQTIALHEIGHLSGLSHSALGETELVAGGRRVVATDAVMFPIAFGPGTTFNRTLHDDDVAGISVLYPDAGFTEATGSLSGLVTENGQGVFGAHVVAFNPSTGAMVGGFSLDSQGRFVIRGLSPGPYALRVEPLDDADTDSFIDGVIDIDFRVAFFNHLAVVPRNGQIGGIEIAVAPK
jgi:hypothetical protein